MIKKLHLCILAATISTMAGGCTTSFKEGLGIVTGANGKYVPVKIAGDLSQYGNFELGQITDDSGGNTPPEFRQLLEVEFGKQLAEAKLPETRGEKTAVITGRIIHYEDKSTVSSMVKPLEEVIMRATMVDSATGAKLAEANCIGRTTTRSTLGTGRKAEGLAKAFVNWIKSGYPEKAD